MSEQTFEFMYHAGTALLSIEARYESGNTYSSHLMITNGKLVITQAEAPMNPAIPIDKVKELIAEWESRNA
ncbi:MAG: hypothetical protein ACPG7F_01145 [Aggregatilineales bacterium]